MNTTRRHAYRSLLGAIVIIATTLVAPLAAHAKPSFAPHIGRSIVPTRAEWMGSQLATWYGPGLYGNGTACGQRLRRSTWGIAHRTLPCGTLVTIANGSRKVTVRVIDRGPFSGATVDLTSRTREYLGFTSGRVNMSRVKAYRLVPRNA